MEVNSNNHKVIKAKKVKQNMIICAMKTFNGNIAFQEFQIEHF